MSASGRHTGWRFDPTNSRADYYFRGTRVGHIDANGLTAAAGMASDTTVTAGTGFTVPTGNVVTTAGDERVTAGNLRLGVISTFGTTEPTSAVVMKVGTNPEGAITTSGGVFCTTGGATLSKIIADGTVSQVEA